MKKILLVASDNAFFISLNTFLNRHVGGYQLIFAPDIGKAFFYLTDAGVDEQPFSMIIISLYSIKEAMYLASTIKESNFFNHVPIIACCESDDMRILMQGLSTYQIQTEEIGRLILQLFAPKKVATKS